MDSFWDFFWLLLSAFFFLAYLVVLVQILGDLLGDRELSGWWKAVWVLFRIVVPALTALVYLVVRGRGMAGRGDEASARAREPYRGMSSGRAPVDQIATARTLLDSGAIDEAEYRTLKERALA